MSKKLTDAEAAHVKALQAEKARAAKKEVRGCVGVGGSVRGWVGAWVDRWAGGQVGG